MEKVSRATPGPGGPVHRLRELARLISGSDTAGIRRIAEEANRIVLEYRLTSEQILATIAGIPQMARLLTGHGHQWSAEEVVCLLQRRPDLVRLAFTKFPGKKSMINLDKLTNAINEGEFDISEND
jgi:hypothetical protein